MKTLGRNDRYRENGSLLYQNDTLSPQDDSMSYQNDTLPPQDDSMSYQNDTLLPQDDSVSYQNHTLPQDDSVSYQNDTLLPQDDTVSYQNDTLPTQNSTLPSQDDTMSHQNDTLSPQNDTLSQQNETLPYQNDAESPSVLDDSIDSFSSIIDTILDMGNATSTALNVTLMPSSNPGPNPQDGCLNITFFPSYQGYELFFNFSSLSMEVLFPITIFYLYGSDGSLIESSENSTYLCYDTNECRYLYIEGSGNVEVRVDGELLTADTLLLNNPTFIRFGSCIDDCDGLNELVITGNDYMLYNTTQIVEEVELPEVSMKKICLDPSSCMKLLGNAAFLLNKDGMTINNGVTFSDIETFGICRSQCEDLPELVTNDRNRDIFVALTSISDMVKIGDVKTHYYQAACWLIYDDLLQVVATDDNLIQRYILGLLYFLFQGEDWVHGQYFLSPLSECNWHTLIAKYDQFADGYIYFNEGVHCNEAGKLNKIMLAVNNLIGYLPEEISWLTELEYMNLADNQIDGEIPIEYGSFDSLQTLFLFGNLLTGSIPSSIYSLRALERINFSGNMLTGKLSQFQSTSLWQYFFQENLFTGSIPSDVGDLSNLMELRVESNLFTGTIPESIQNLGNLKLCVLMKNELTGTIPSKIFMLPFLETLLLRNNMLTGVIPSAVVIGNSSVTDVQFGYNKLSGTIPPELVSLEFLQKFRLNDNVLTGVVPATFIELVRLNTFTIENNNITGTVPFTNCSQFLFLEADCDSPQKVSCQCCKSCAGIFTIQSDHLPCYYGNLELVFDNLYAGQYINFHINNMAGEIVVDTKEFLATNSSYTISSETCVSLTDCLMITFYYWVGYPFQLKLLMDGKEILNEEVEETWSFENNWAIDTDIYVGYSSTNGFEKDVCDSYDLCSNTEVPYSSLKRLLLNRLVKFINVDDLGDNSTFEYKSSCVWVDYLALQNEETLHLSEHMQHYVLSLFYYITNGDDWIYNDLWLSNGTMCGWYGVTCDDYNIVVKIDLSTNNLYGSIPTSFMELRGLKSLTFNDNQVTGTIPEQIVLILGLEQLQLSENHLNNTIPYQISYNTKFVNLALSSNSLTGFMPDEIGLLQDLEELNLNNNSFSGEMPNSFYELLNLKKLILGGNLFSGEVDNVTSMVQIELLDLSDNYFAGKLPLSDQQTHMQLVSCNGNTFSGTVPDISGMTRLEQLMLYNNELTGTLPSSIGSVQTLTHVSLSYNSLKGEIPQDVFLSENLVLLHFHGNSIEGDADKFSYTIDDYITDCGGTATVDAIVSCNTCSYCCNDQGECLSRLVAWPSKTLANNPFNATAPIYVVLVTMLTFAILYILCLFIRSINRRKLPALSWSVREEFQQESVYKFFLTRSLKAHCIALFMVGVHIFTLFIFLRAADSTYDNADSAYLFSCPDDNLECSSASQLTKWPGWVMFLVILIIFLLPDAISSCLLTYESVTLSDKRGLFAGLMVLFVTVFSGLVSFIYNAAIGTADTEIIMNAAVLLFLNDLDEKLYEIIKAIFPDWVDTIDADIKEFNDFINDELNIVESISDSDSEEELDDNENKDKKKDGEDPDGEDGQDPEEISVMKDKINSLEKELGAFRKEVAMIYSMLREKEVPQKDKDQEVDAVVAVKLMDVHKDERNLQDEEQDIQRKENEEKSEPDLLVRGQSEENDHQVKPVFNDGGGSSKEDEEQSEEEDLVGVGECDTLLNFLSTPIETQDLNQLREMDYVLTECEKLIDGDEKKPP